MVWLDYECWDCEFTWYIKTKRFYLMSRPHNQSTFFIMIYAEKSTVPLKKWDPMEWIHFIRKIANSDDWYDGLNVIKKFQMVLMSLINNSIYRRMNRCLLLYNTLFWDRYCFDSFIQMTVVGKMANIRTMVRVHIGQIWSKKRYFWKCLNKKYNLFHFLETIYQIF